VRGETSHVEGAPRTAEEEIRIARTELRRGDLAHAARHASFALAVDPLRPDWRSLLDDIFDSAADAPALLPLETGENYYGHVAARARALAHAGRLDEALDLLCRVVHAHPTPAYLEWGREWLQEPGAAEAASATAVANLVALWVQRFPGRELAMEAVWRRAWGVHPEASMLAFAGASLLRRAGRLDAAETAARQCYALSGDWHGAVAIALVHRARGQVDESVAWYRRAQAHDPSDLTAHLDIGDMLLDAGRSEEARAAYEAVLERDPSHPWALPSCLFIRARAGDGGAREQLRTLGSDPAQERAVQLARELGETAEPYVHYLPEPSEASINLLRRLLERFATQPPAPGDALSVTLSGPEAPSCRLAIDRQLVFSAFDIRVQFTVKAVPTPDPRTSDPRAEHVLWEFDGFDARPALPPPRADVADTVARLAQTPFHLHDWRRRAREAAARLGPDAERSLLAVMVHPPVQQGEARSWVWIQAVQTAAALLIAHLDRGWAGSARRRLLLSLLRGPMDWTVDAAIIALSAIVEEDSDAALEAPHLFLELEGRIPDAGHCCYEYALMCHWMRLPGLAPAERDALVERRRRIEEA
jgi:tetratricopeptide (TPR) repeat protein